MAVKKTKKVPAKMAPTKKTPAKVASKKTSAKVSSTKKVVAMKASKEKPAEKAKKEAKPKRVRNWSMMVKADQLTKEALKLITKVDDLETKIADLQDTLQETLALIPDEVGNPSFEHPERGPMCIMNRGDKWFWRSKPAGAARKAA